jgi:2-polyprenyl-3-methyl-5-hydroxy-6-metoxy-1,4-benzoquinol methylase
MTSARSLADIRAYYGSQVDRQLDDFIEGNPRIECAWSTLGRLAPTDPERILEIGCGIGSISWRMSQRWPRAEVVALDVSPELLRIGQALFASPRIRFVEGPLRTGLVEGYFDVVVLMDVYEHIARDDRREFHQALAGLLRDQAQVFLSAPTPRHLRWLRANFPHEIQPVDEDVTVETLLEFASTTGTNLCFYKEVDVWHRGDYLHAAFVRGPRWLPVVNAAAHRTMAARWVATVGRPFRGANGIPSRAARAGLVRERLGYRATNRGLVRVPPRGPSNLADCALSGETLDIYIVRSAIERALRWRLQDFHGTVLDIGAGHGPYKELLLRSPSSVEKYIGLDLISNEYPQPDLEWDGQTIPLDTSSIDCALATEVFEHCPEPELVMREALRVLKPGGFLFFSVPFLWPLHDVPGDEYRYTPFALRRHLAHCGFSDVELEALGGWDASLGQMLGLWVRRRPMTSRKRRVLSQIALPIVRSLLARDQPPQEFGESTMFTGLVGIATKPAA